MTLTILQIVLALLTVGGTILAMWIKHNSDKQKRIEDEDKKIDAITNGDDVTHIGDELRNK